MPNSNRNFDVILLGATGFTGQLVAEYFHKAYSQPEQLKWAMAGRNLEKLERVRQEIGAEDIPVLQADSHDPASLDKLAEQTRVLCTTVGPYAQHGSETVAACVRAGTHYCDLTGEVQWIKRMVDAHHQEAESKKVKIVHCCGFDSIPSDLGVMFLQQQAQEKFGAYAQTVKTGVKAMSGGFSGGTVASMMNLVAEAEADKSIYKVLFDPYSLNPEDRKQGPASPDLRSVKYDVDFESWTSPFVMAAINTRVVRRGLALADFPYGEDFRYDEFSLTGDGLSGRLKGVAVALPLGLMMSAKPGSVAKWFLQKITPDPGEGPSREAQEKGFWVFYQLGLLSNGEKIMTKISGDRDPGYGSTSKMLGEAAVCLAKDQLPETFGVMGPARAMGDPLLKRLPENAGVRFEVKD